MLAVVVAGGDLVTSRRTHEAVRDADLLIAADSGARHLQALGRRADLLVGDFDSYLPGPADAVEQVRFPLAKDQTDTHLALREAVSRGATRIRLLAALRGPRLDHAAANLMMLCAEEFAGVDLRAIDGTDELAAVRGNAQITGRRGDLVTLLAVTATCTGVTTAGLQYVLNEAELFRGDSRGVSNVMAGARARISVSNGVLLLIHRDGGDPNRLL
jgi:thiamine pyrophosphokinase